MFIIYAVFGKDHSYLIIIINVFYSILFRYSNVISVEFSPKIESATLCCVIIYKSIILPLLLNASSGFLYTKWAQS